MLPSRTRGVSPPLHSDVAELPEKAEEQDPAHQRSTAGRAFGRRAMRSRPMTFVAAGLDAQAHQSVKKVSAC